MSDENVADVLSRAFPQEILRKKDGQGGRKLTYVPGWAVIERLNDALGVGKWGWESDYHLEGSTVIVTGILTALGQRYVGEDAAVLMQRRGGNGLAPDAMANAVKGAATGALVRASRLLGVGLHLYRSGAVSEAEVDAAAAHEQEEEDLRGEISDEAARQSVGMDLISAGCQKRYRASFLDLSSGQLQDVLDGLKSRAGDQQETAT